MARKKKQDNTSDNIQNIVNDASVSEKKTSQKRAHSKVEDASSNKKPEIAELEDRLGISIDYNEEENVITLTPNRPQQSVSSLRQLPLDADEFVSEGDEVSDYVFGAAQLLPLINRCELYLIGRAFTPSVADKLWEPTDGESPVEYGDMANCDVSTFNSDPWNLFIYSKAGRQAVTFGELTSGTFYLQCAAAEYVLDPENPSITIKRPMKDVYYRQMYRKVYFNGQTDQFPRINISSYQGEDPQTGELTTTQYDKYQYVANEEHFSANHIVWPQRKVTFYFNNLNFLCDVKVVEGDDPNSTSIQKNDNNSRNEQVVEFLLPDRWTGDNPSLEMTFKITVRKNVSDLKNAYKYAVKKDEGVYWGGTIGYTLFDDSDAVLTPYFINATRSNTPPNSFEEIIVSSMFPQKNTLLVSLIDHDINVHIQPVQKNYTKKFIIMTDGNVIVTDITELNDYLHLYTKEQLQETNAPDQIIVSYQNTIGFLSTSSEWPWNKTIRVRTAIASEYQGIRFKAIGRYNDMYDEYVKYRQGIKSDFAWDTSVKEIEGITCTPRHNEEGDYTNKEPYIDYDISIDHQALDESYERQIFYLAFEPIPKFVSTTLKIFIGYNPDNLQVTTNSGTRLNEESDTFIVRNEDLWSFRYTTKQNDFGEDYRDPAQEGFLFKITNNNISTSNYSHVFISDNTTAIRDKIELPESDKEGEKSTTFLAFTGRIYHNMSLFIRPLIAAKIKFRSNQPLEFGPTDQHFYIEYNGNKNVPLESDFQLTSEDDLKFSVYHGNDPNSVYTYISVDISYGSYRWNNIEGSAAGGSTHIIPNTNTLKFTINGFKNLMVPTIEYCYVTLNLHHIYKFLVSIKHPANTTYWPEDSSALIYKGRLTVEREREEIIISAEKVETSTTDGVTTTKYIFSTIYGNTATGSIDINDRHCCGRAVKPDGSYVSLTTDQYARQKVSIPITVNAVVNDSDSGYILDIQPFKEMQYQFMYQSGSSRAHVTVVPYTFNEYKNGWPANMDDINNMTVQESLIWHPTSGKETSSILKTPDLRMPLFGFRLKAPVDDDKKLDIFSKMTLKLQIVTKDGTVGPWTIASDYAFENTESLFGVCPGSITDKNAREYFYPEYNGDPDVIYQFEVQMTSRIAAEDLRITKVVYAKHTGGTDTINETDNNGINAIDDNHRLPGENPRETSGNLEVYVHVPHTLDTDHTLSLEFLDLPIDSYSGPLTAMYPMDTGVTQVSENIYKFSVTTKKNEVYCVESPNHTFYSGDNQYTMKVKYNDNQYHFPEEVETCTYYMHPVFLLWFNDGITTMNSFLFDADGKATIYFSVHIAGAPDADHPNGTTRTPDKTKESDPDMKLPPAESTYDQSSWNRLNPLLQISNASGLLFRCDGITYHIIEAGYFYKLEVSGGKEFRGTANFQLNVFNKTKTATLSNTVKFSNITWWNGSSEITTQDLNAAYLSPVTRFDSNGKPMKVIDMTATVAQETGHELNLDNVHLSCGLSCEGIITCSVALSASSPNQLSISITMDSTNSSYREYGAQKIDEWNLSLLNEEHPELSDFAHMLYTGRPIPFKLSIDDSSYMFYIKMGAVLFIWVDNTTGGEMKPHTGQEHVVRARAREWYSLDGGATVIGMGNYYNNGEDTSYTDRLYYAKFEYYNGSSYSEIPIVTPSASNIKSERNGNGFNIVAPTCWQDSTGKWHNGTNNHTTPTGPGDWGAWRMTITDESHANESGKMRVTMQVEDNGSPTHSLYNWYPTTGPNATSFEMNVRDFMTVSGIHWWTGAGNNTKGDMSFDKAVLPPVMRDDNTTLWVFLTFADTSQLNLTAATVTTGYTGQIMSTKGINTTGETITTHANDGNTYTNSYDLVVLSKVLVNLDEYNLGNTPTFYTGKPIKYTLTIPGLNGSDGFATNFEIPLGPVIALHNGTPNSINPPHNDGAVLKPVAGNQSVSQTRGYEWYMGSDNAIHITSNGNVNNDTEQSHTWNVTWSFNGIDLTATSSPDTSYNRQFAYPNNENPCIKIQHPASWTETNDDVHPSDGGAWLISILNTTDPTTGKELDGTLIGTVTVTDENDSLPVCKKVYEFYPSKNTIIGISKYAYVSESYWVRGVKQSGSTWTSDLVSCGPTMTELVLNPLVITNSDYSNIEIYMNVQSESELKIDYYYICEDLDVAQCQGLYVGIVNGDNEDTTPGGQPYTHVAIIGLTNPLIEVFSNEVYSGKIFNTRLFAKQGETEVWSKTIPITIGRFGDAKHEHVPIIMSGAPGVYPKSRTYTFYAYGRFILNLGDSVIYPINNNGTDVHGEVTFSDSALKSIVSVSYESDENKYTVSIPAWNSQAAPPKPQEWAGGSITSKITLQEPWYIADGPFTKEIRFERYLNFYREDSDSNDYVLADCQDGFYFYCDSLTITNEPNYKHQFSGSSLKIKVHKKEKEVFYMTFRVTTTVSGYALIKRITYDEWDGNTTAIYWCAYDTPRSPKYKINSNFNSSDIKNDDYFWFGKCTLVRNDYSSQLSNFYIHNTLELSNGETGRYTYNWNLGQGGDDVLWSSSLDEYPIWSNRWTPSQ